MDTVLGKALNPRPRTRSTPRVGSGVSTRALARPSFRPLAVLVSPKESLI